MEDVTRVLYQDRLRWLYTPLNLRGYQRRHYCLTGQVLYIDGGTTAKMAPEWDQGDKPQ